MFGLHDHGNDAEVSHPLALERRRPGRIENVSPHLIPLLRGGTEAWPEDEERRDTDLAPAIGIAVSVLISALMWAVLLLL